MDLRYATLREDVFARLFADRKYATAGPGQDTVTTFLFV
jgi:hypothetical protein